jgi:hypothetical protein
MTLVRGKSREPAAQGRDERPVFLEFPLVLALRGGLAVP